MNPQRVNEYDYINFLIATQKAYSCTEAERVQPDSDNAAAHDAITRCIKLQTTRDKTANKAFLKPHSQPITIGYFYSPEEAYPLVLLAIREGRKAG